ncbi:MAG: DUF4215 domain-containing protein [Patescibacteria group bacterium]
MSELWKSNQLFRLIVVFLCLGLISGIVFYPHTKFLVVGVNLLKAETISTSVTISACGNGVVETGEGCDDGNNVSGDGCSSTCQSEAGGGGQRTTPYEETIYYTRVILEGKAYPESLVNILKDGQFLTSTRADSQAAFRMEIKDLTSGTYTFGLWAEDKYGEKSPTFTITFYVASTTTTTVSGILLPPTIKLSKDIILKGEGLEISGQATPESQVEISIYSEKPLKEIFKNSAIADSQGDWFYLFDTENLEPGIYEIKAKSTSKEGLLSIFSKTLSFEISLVSPPLPPIPPEFYSTADLNKDSRINLIDFSIMLYWWGRSNEYADQNGDGIVDLIDFSIMMYYWTG